MNTKTSTINLKVILNEKNIPTSIKWSASDQNGKWNECKAFLLSLFELESRDTLKIDLWTEEMQVVEMDRFVYHTIKALADTYIRATNNTDLANEMQKFAQFFAEKTEIIPSK